MADPASAPNLRVKRVTLLGQEEASLKVEIEVENIGRGAAGAFRTDVYQTTPQRWPLLLTLCPLTVEQRAAGGSAPCGSPFAGDGLAARESVTYTAWITWPVGRESTASTTVRENIEVMADGCFAPLEPDLPDYCRVQERNERNNTRRVRNVALPVIAP